MEAPLPNEEPQFRATAGTAQGFGITPRAALDALLAAQSDTFATPIVIWPFNRGDAFFTEAQQARLQYLKSQREPLDNEEWAELEGLVEASFNATIARTKSLQQQKS